MVLLPLLLACDPAPKAPTAADPVATAPAPLPAVSLTPGGAGSRSVLPLLDRVDDMVLTLSPDNLGADADQAQRIVLDHGWSMSPVLGDTQGTILWQRPSPVTLAQKRHSTAPPGLRLLTDGEALDFDPRVLEESLARRWVLYKDRIYVRSRVDPGGWREPPVLEYDGPGLREADRNRDRSGQAPAAFVQQQFSLGADTRRCLYLPAPSAARIELALPADQAVLRYAVGIAETEDGHEATARFDVAVTSADADRGVVQSELVETASGWRDGAVDLSHWAGQTVVLELSTDPLGDPERDYVCVATPELIGPAPATADPVRIVVVGIDTLRADHLGVNGHDRDTSPELDAFAARSVLFDRAWAPAPRTRPSFRTSTTGRWPLRALQAPTFGEVLRARGFRTAGVVANVHLAPRLGFADGFDWWHYDSAALADGQVDLALAWLRGHASEDSFLFLHLMDPHIFYNAPGPWLDRYTQGLDRGDVPDRFNRWLVDSWDAEGLLTDDEKAWIEGRYDGEVAWTDHQLGRLFEGLDALPGRTLVVVHTDHGEEFWDHGGFEHNHSLYDELTRTLLWFQVPGTPAAAPRRLDHPASLADLAPTLYDAVGVPPAERPETDGTSLWPLLQPGPAGQALAATLDARPLHQGYLMFDTERWSVVARPPGGGALHKFIVHTMDGRTELYDLDADPDEQHDLSAETDPAPWLQTLSDATSWPAGIGWRMHVEGLAEPLRLEFAEPVQAAGVIDPEAASTRRANLEWGEVPAVLPEDVAKVTVEEGGRVVQVLPGTKAAGTVYVLAGEQGEVVEAGGARRPLKEGVALLGGGAVRLSRGPMLVPTETEAAALAAQAEAGLGGTAGQLEALRALGYIGED